ncbi:D-alanyl-D-alanine carboxypeptidase [Rhizobium sp. BK376]|uniref:D-alanyl-D-alanine carboxypeptidase n=1 Tax=Rhizobium sp. BK376 TaxID=2512149 RepID=UPI001049BF4E|nr:D-alanyl-D-alanine carboxypeptidase [Rhizobium sp. BK376]TCR93457.1 D-alanyl-D-alanine carboxypeptidase (penicillin-binding protein 5/6) [Rhizobium sp. BK376]
MKRMMMILSAAAALLGSSIAAVAGSAYFVMDAKTGKVLASDDADTLNHPASLTKMMTLYLTFDAIHRGKIGWETRVPVSQNAANKHPTKLFLKAGSTVTVRDAVNGMITRSANDAAAAMAEEIGGSEGNFARLMTQKARQLGMSRTTFVNASGLPDDRQVTTARDMSTLAVALINDFPREYRLFSQRSFVYNGTRINGHNNLMYRYKGMDGIKTGYTNASGFNLVSAVKDGNRRVVGVVMGGPTARSRDDKMASLLNRYMDDASAKSGARLVASVGSRGKSKAVEVASASDDGDVPVPSVASRPDDVTRSTASAGDVTLPLDRPQVADEIQNAGKPKEGRWQLQIGATPDAKAARALLEKAQSKTGGPLEAASPYTEAVGKGRGRLYRARFTGFESRDAADAACSALKKNDFECLLLPSQG